MHTKTNYDVAIIGAGVVGGAIARELSRYDLDVIILDKENDVCVGTSKANSAIVHAGYDPMEGSLIAKLNVEGNALFEKLCKELSVPFKRNGSLVLAFDDQELNLLEVLRKRGVENGVPDLEILSKETLLKKEPHVNPEVKGALYAKTGGIVDPMLLTISLVENAVENGVDCLLNFNVDSIERENEGYKILSADQEVVAEYVINAAGIYSDKIHNMVAPPSFEIKPLRGQYFLLDKSQGEVIRSTIFPCPGKSGKGILVAPTVRGNVLLGPGSDSALSKEDLTPTDEVLLQTKIGAQRLVPSISTKHSIRTFVGLRATADVDDFIIEEVAEAPGFIDVAGIKSPGLTAAPAIALYTVSLLKNSGLTLKKDESFSPIVKRRLTMDLTKDELNAEISKNPLYGKIICRCENVTEGDIIDSIRRTPGAVTTHGVKRRCRAGMGRCQGNYCGPKVQEILARELGVAIESTVLEKGK